MERHFSTGVSTIVALMAVQREVSGRADIPPDAAEDIHFVLDTEVDCAAKHVVPRDAVGDWLSSLARARRASMRHQR
jgi:hypothetical protein